MYIFSGLNDDSANGFNLRQKFINLLKSLVLQTEKHPLRLIFITDHRSVFQIEKTFEDTLPPFPLENEVFSGKVPRFSREYVQVGPIVDLVEPWTTTMKTYFNHAKERFTYENKDPGYFLTFNHTQILAIAKKIYLLTFISVYIRGFINFEITVGCGLKCHWYLRTLNLKFKKRGPKLKFSCLCPDSLGGPCTEQADRAS